MSETLKRRLDELKALPFPDAAESDELADWIADLAELDGHIVGLACTSLGGSRATRVPKGDVEEMKRRLVSIKYTADEDVTVRKQCEAYLVALGCVVDVL